MDETNRAHTTGRIGDIPFRGSSRWEKRTGGLEQSRQVEGARAPFNEKRRIAISGKWGEGGSSIRDGYKPHKFERLVSFREN